VTALLCSPCNDVWRQPYRRPGLPSGFKRYGRLGVEMESDLSLRQRPLDSGHPWLPQWRPAGVIGLDTSSVTAALISLMTWGPCPGFTVPLAWYGTSRAQPQQGTWLPQSRSRSRRDDHPGSTKGQPTSQ